MTVNAPEKSLEPGQLSFPTILEQVQATQEKRRQERDHRTHLKRIVEALLFSSSDPIPLDKIRTILETVEPIRPAKVRELIQELSEEYRQTARAFQIEEVATGYLLKTRFDFHPFIEQLNHNRRGEKLSQAAAEVLAIVAFRQGVTRAQIDAIRGVDSSGSLASLMERELVEAIGKQSTPGRPTLYGVTKTFLTHFGFKDLKDLSRSVN